MSSSALPRATTKMLVGGGIIAAFGIIVLTSLKGVPGKNNADYFADPSIAVALLKKKVGTPLVVLELDIRAKNIMGFKVQNQNHKEQIDQYIVLGGKVINDGPDAMTRGMTEEQINSRVINVDEINFSLLPTMAKAALANTKLRDAHVELVDMSSGGGQKYTWTVHLRDSRGSNDMPDFDKNGALIMR